MSFLYSSKAAAFGRPSFIQLIPSLVPTVPAWGGRVDKMGLMEVGFEGAYQNVNGGLLPVPRDFLGMPLACGRWR